MARYYTNRGGGPVDFGGLQGPPLDIKVLLGVLFVLFTMGFIQPLRAFVDLLYLSPEMLGKGYFWQLLTYAVAPESSGIWFLVTMLILFLFGRDVFRMLGRRRFWHMLLTAVLSASLVATAVHGVMVLLGLQWTQAPLIIMRGGEMLLTVLVAAFATLYPNATIRLFFVLPIRARSFLWLEILLAFVLWLLPTGDLAGFLGVCTAVGVTYAVLTGGIQRNLRELRLRTHRWWIEQRLRRARNKRGMHIVKPDEGGDARRKPGDVRRGPWIH